MKVMLCANTSWFIYNFCQTLTDELQSHGHQVCVVAPFDQHTRKLQEKGMTWIQIDLHQTSKNPLTELRALLQLWRAIRTIKPDVVLTYTIKCNVYIGLLAKISHFRQIATIAGLGEGFAQNYVLTSVIRYLYQWAFTRVQKVFFQNAEDSALFLQSGILPAYKHTLIPGLGVNVSKFTPAPSQDARQARIFLMFGRLLVQKGYDLFLQAAEFFQTQSTPNAAFWILGIQDTSRQASAQLFEQIQDCHARQIIRYLPPTDDVVAILRQVDIVVLPSGYNEGVPASLLEAMACGKPIITTNWKGCKDAVDDGVNGMLIEKGNLESLKKAIEFFLKAEPEILDAMGNASRQKVEQEFDEYMIISKYLQEIDHDAVRGPRP